MRASSSPPGGGALDGLEEFGAVPDLQERRSATWTSTRWPALCTPTLICCQATETTPLAATSRETHSSLVRSWARASKGRGGMVAGRRRAFEEPAARGWQCPGTGAAGRGCTGGNPGVELGLGAGQGGEHPAGEELGAQGPAEPLDLAGGGRGAGRGEQVLDPVLPTGPVEQHLDRAGG